MLTEYTKVHFIGIGGYGMSALAQILLEKGMKVTGSDMSSSPRTEYLKDLGAEIYNSHQAENVHGADLVVYSTAIPKENPEKLEAENLGLSLWHRSELLAEMINSKYGIAVTGAHGKTTTTSMLSLILKEANTDPTCIIGGVLPNFGSNARTGSGDYVVAEACESDHSFLRYHPTMAVITNIEADHLEHYNGSFQQLLESYRQFIDNVDADGTVIINSECQYMDMLIEGLNKDVRTFGLSETAQVRADQLQLTKGAVSFQVKTEDLPDFIIELSVPGEHNVLNALAATAVALSLNIDVKYIQSALQKFKGAKRRFTEVGRFNGAVVIDDYAHHPTEIKATLKTAREQGDHQVIAVFQPHRFTRTKYLMSEFASAFDYADKIILHQVFAAGEEEILGINSQELANQINIHCPGADVQVEDNMDDILETLTGEVNAGDYVITMGAGDIWKVAEWLADRD